eukprot:gene16953-biopygen11500
MLQWITKAPGYLCGAPWQYPECEIQIALIQLLKRSAQISGRLPSEQERTRAVTWVKNQCGAYSMRMQRRSCPSQVHVRTRRGPLGGVPVHNTRQPGPAVPVHNTRQPGPAPIVSRVPYRQSWSFKTGFDESTAASMPSERSGVHTGSEHPRPSTPQGVEGALAFLDHYPGLRA